MDHGVDASTRVTGPASQCYVHFYLPSAPGTDALPVTSGLRLTCGGKLIVELTAPENDTFERAPLYNMVGASIDALCGLDGTLFRGLVFAVTMDDGSTVRLNIVLDEDGLGETPLHECALAPELISALHLASAAELRPDTHDKMAPNLLTLDFPAAPGTRFAPEAMEQWTGRPINVVRHRDGTVATGIITAAAVLQDGAAAAVTIAVHDEGLFAELAGDTGPYSAAAADG